MSGPKTARWHATTVARPKQGCSAILELVLFAVPTHLPWIPGSAKIGRGGNRVSLYLAKLGWDSNPLNVSALHTLAIAQKEGLEPPTSTLTAWRIYH